MDLLEQSKTGIEIETCVYPTDYTEEDGEIPHFEILDRFYGHLSECLEVYGKELLLPSDINIEYDKWQLAYDASIRCPNTTEAKDSFKKENITYQKDYKLQTDDDLINYSAVEIITSIYNYNDINFLCQSIEHCLLSGEFAYGFNSSQGIHYNISNTVLNEMEEERRCETIQRFLELMWVFEYMFVSFLPAYRKTEVNFGKFCNSLHRVFGTIENLRANWRNFFIKNEDIYKEIDSGLGEYFTPKYTMVNLKNITADSTAGVYFEFRFGSIHMIPELMKAWIIMLSFMIISSINTDLYNYLMSTAQYSFDRRNLKNTIEQQEKVFNNALENVGGANLVKVTLDVIKKLPLNGLPGTG